MTETADQDVFAFDEANHRYTLNGRVLPSITQVLDLTGFVDKTWFRPEHAARGKAVHAACQFLIEGKLDWSTVHPEILPRVEAFARWLEMLKPATVLLSEEPLYSRAWKFAGTPDLLLSVNGTPFLIDIKSGRSGIAAELQTAAQEILVRENKELPPVPIRRFALELTREGKARMIPHGSNTGDRTMFLNALGMVKRRINEGEVSL